MATKRIGVIGLGSIGSRHGRNLEAMGHTVIGYDPAMYEYSHTLAEAMSADAIVIASPTSFHYEHLVKAAGKPIFVEKPIADTPLAGLLFDFITQYPFMVGYNLRFHSCVKKAKEWLDAGLIGKPLWANFTCAQYNDKPAYLRDGVILNWSHEIDLALYLLGPAKVAASSTRLTDGSDDMADILLTHGDGCRTSVHLDYVADPESRTFSIVGEEGIISSNLVARWMVIISRSAQETFIGEDSFDDNYIEEMQAFIDRIDGKETIGATGADGLRTLEICLEVRKQAGL